VRVDVVVVRECARILAHERGDSANGGVSDWNRIAAFREVREVPVDEPVRREPVPEVSGPVATGIERVDEE
jgi:hypothetical protein